MQGFLSFQEVGELLMEIRMFSAQIRKRLVVAILTCVIVSMGSEVFAQGQAQSNMIGNGGFENSFRRENLWDGVDSGGFLTGERGALPVLVPAGTISDTSMPVSVSVADMNGDGLLDIVAMDPPGYLRIYFNAGSKTEPKFELGDLAGVFLSRVTMRDPLRAELPTNADRARQGPRVVATTLFRSGKYDLLIGNYLGELMGLLNAGTSTSPNFRQPQSVESILIATSPDPRRRWGNLFAPATADWNQDGREDVLLGEGSYSANNIHLLLNEGGGNRPNLIASPRQIVAYGDGLMQLHPAVVDYNGDGHLDLLVSERSGRVALYLNTGQSWRGGSPPPELKFDSFLKTSAGTDLNFGGICSLSTGDLNGDGKFDLLVGRSNGRISLVYNKGEAQQPKFDAPVDLKGTSGTPQFTMPAGWDLDYGLNRGNFLFTVETRRAKPEDAVQPAEGSGYIYFGYQKSHNRVLPSPVDAYLAAAAPRFTAEASAGEGRLNGDAPARAVILSQSGRARLRPGARYLLTFKVRGAKVQDAAAAVRYIGERRQEGRQTVGERGQIVDQSNRKREVVVESVKFFASPQWSEVRKEFTVNFKDRDLMALEQVTNVQTSIVFILSPDGELMLDDVQLVAR